MNYIAGDHDPNEVLRLYPPVVQQFRYTSKRTKIGDLSIPAGVRLMLSNLLIHRGSQVWGEDAEKFRPERCSDGISKGAKDQAAFFSFWMGTQDLLRPKLCNDRSQDGIGYDSAELLILAFTLIYPCSSHRDHSSTSTWSSNYSALS